MSTNTLIEQQHQIFQLLHRVTNDYKGEVNQAESRRGRETQESITEWNQAKSLANTQLEEIRKLQETAKEAAKGWKNNISGPPLFKHLDQPPIPTTGIDLKQEIARCHTTATKMYDEITAFTKSNSESGNMTCFAAIIGAVLGGISCIIPSAIVAQIYGGGGGIPLGLLIGLAIMLLIIWAGSAGDSNNVKKINNLFATLNSAVTNAEYLTTAYLKTLQTNHQHQLATIENRYQSEINKAEERYTARFAEEVSPAFIAFHQAAEQRDFLSIPWNDADWRQWQPSTSLTPITRIGTFHPERIPADIPALVACPGGDNILLKTRGPARNIAIEAIQSLMLRLLATLPPGKIRFTLIDPIGLGQNVATFMQLADHSEKLVNSRAWTEPGHIEHQLADLSEHMETVIQKYLRGQYQTIEEYNAQAGEVAEPYRVLVVIGFPMNFTEETARRLVKIATNGPRCGVSTVVMVDTEQLSTSTPYSFNMEELERVSTVIARHDMAWDDQHFVWQDEDFKDCKMQLDAPPALEVFNNILKKVGEEAKLAEGVKVPFKRIAPPVQEWWKGSTREGLNVPLGRAGATKFQYLDLGKGTAQHALVVGKTGSGKTTLLHILIMNLCLTYSPDELELYLVDFKTVGFTPYATYKLPHARVVAIQSEREFGLSVLQGLDSELERRKQLYSKAGVQDFAQYRGVQPGVRMPRILLLVDEFQEFFTQDDRVAHDATLLLDRLVRQGRAFGIHVMLGSQTLAGSYSLARATIGQMAVRIALQCEETDSRLVLSDDNPAARLLSRPGEAIYNSANGLVEGNNPFQCSWLPDDELDTYLVDIQKFAERHEQRRSQPSWKQIIFDGSKDGDVTTNIVFQNVLKAPTWPTPQKTVPVWLGDPIAIKEPTAALIRSQAGNNLLIIGQQEEAALGMLLTGLLSLAAQHKPDSANYYVADFSPVDASYAGLFNSVAQVLPHGIKVIGRRDLPKVITQIADEVQDCIEAGEGRKIPTYLFFYGLQRARDLRPSEEYSFSSFGSEGSTEVSTAKQFTTILREGPELGVHTFAWCDTLANLNRTLERGVLREFDIRVAFQMSQEDSSSLIDSPVANKLGSHRAFLFNEETGGVEKFRPYGLPTEEWLQEVAAAMQRKQ